MVKGVLLGLVEGLRYAFYPKATVLMLNISPDHKS